MKLGAVLLLKKSGSYKDNDLDRGHILFKTLKKFTKGNLFEEFAIIVPDNEVGEIKESYFGWIDHFNIRVLGEGEIAPQLNNYRNMRGWRKQQILKLAIANHFTCDYYITFDADIICLKDISKDDLLPGGKAILQLEKCSLHPKWWKSSSRIIDARHIVIGMKDAISVTPAILSRHVVLLTQTEIEKSNNTSDWVDWLCNLHLPKHPKNWCLKRFLMLKWTEYSLYYLTLLKYDLFDKYHVLCSTEEVPQRLLVHDAHPFEKWAPSINFNQSCPGLFCVVGSKSFISPDSVWDKIQPFV
ncbi:DUF6492 family protein [Alteromonas lipotrueiana]|uniref:DUF6492 family protein n=1 Tax=Alteromonas lipotrueiana TaxID=2803815 RepID=UPI001C46FF26|nr:DUF6492 family protein [Alteromonas lipotrueiana]